MTTAVKVEVVDSFVVVVVDVISDVVVEAVDVWTEVGFAVEVGEDACSVVVVLGCGSGVGRSPQNGLQMLQYNSFLAQDL